MWLTTSGIVFLATIVAGCSLLRRPAWFSPITIDYERLPEDKRALVESLDSIGVALNAGRAITLTFDEQQLNRWITARSEMPDVATVTIDPLEYPQISLLDGNHIRVAALLPRSGLELIISCVLEITRTDDQVALRISSAKLGSLSMPRAWIRRVIDAPRLARESGALASDKADFAYVNEFIWPNGDVVFTLEELEITAGRIRLKLKPAR